HGLGRLGVGLGSCRLFGSRYGLGGRFRGSFDGHGLACRLLYDCLRSGSLAAGRAFRLRLSWLVRSRFGCLVSRRCCQIGRCFSDFRFLGLRLLGGPARRLFLRLLGGFNLGDRHSRCGGLDGVHRCLIGHFGCYVRWGFTLRRRRNRFVARLGCGLVVATVALAAALAAPALLRLTLAIGVGLNGLLGSVIVPGIDLVCLACGGIGIRVFTLRAGIGCLGIAVAVASATPPPAPLALALAVAAFVLVSLLCRCGGFRLLFLVNDIDDVVLGLL